jgi:AraC family ethanolamine operon transcriptional activator
MENNNINTFHLESNDFEEMREALSDWDHEYHQVGPGAFSGSIFHVQTGSISIFRNRWEREIHYRGTPPKGTIGVAITINQNGEARWAGQRVTKNDIFLQRAGMEAEYLSAPFWDSIVLAIPKVTLVGHISDLTKEDSDDILNTHSVIPLEMDQVSIIRDAGLACLGMAAHLVTGIEEPFPLMDMADSVVELIAHHLIASQKPKCAHLTHKRQTHLIRKAEAYCMDIAGKPLRIGKLCRELGVSERTLRHVFHKRMNMTPLEYLKSRKLNHVYKVLRKADPAEVLIKQVAYSNGFYHLGQFSRDYKMLFGEIPSQTLRYR